MKAGFVDAIEGYVGKNIDMVKILWHRGFIASGSKALSLEKCQKILQELPDFVNEKSELETNMAKLGILIIFTLKAHCKIAGRGVENIWGE